MSHLNDLLTSFTHKLFQNKHILSMQSCGRVPVSPYLSVCLHSCVLLCTHSARANEKTQMDLICTGINSIKICLHR